MSARVIMLNDYPWAVCTDDRVSDETLLTEGHEEVRRRGWRLPQAERSTNFMPVTYVRVHCVEEIES